jgi:5-methylcytosine-specific restriction endonuclease McrA
MSGNPIYRDPRWRIVRAYVLTRDFRQCKLRLPGCKGRADTGDHIVELEDGGAPFDPSNVQAACRSCNTSKRNTALARRAKQAANPSRDW